MIKYYTKLFAQCAIMLIIMAYAHIAQAAVSYPVTFLGTPNLLWGDPLTNLTFLNKANQLSYITSQGGRFATIQEIIEAMDPTNTGTITQPMADLFFNDLGGGNGIYRIDGAGWAIEEQKTVLTRVYTAAADCTPYTSIGLTCTPFTESDFSSTNSWGAIWVVDVEPSATPEPSILSLYGFGLLGLGYIAYRRQKPQN